MAYVNETSIEADIVIIGAGASGMMAAISAAKTKARVIVIEHTDRVGKKILSTGNGKCNLCHSEIKAEDYNGSGHSFIESAIKRFGPDDTISFFASNGLYTRDRDGYVYPYNEQASGVLDVLRYTLTSMQIPIYTECKVSSISNDKGVFKINTSNNKSFVATKLILCTGGKAAPGTGSDGSGYDYARLFGHSVTNLIPALLKLKSDYRDCKSIDGVRAKGTATLYIDGNRTDIIDEGEIQFTKDGISGIPVFNISRFALDYLAQGRHVSIKTNVISQFDVKKLASEYIYRKENLGSGLSAEAFFTGLVNKKLMLVAMKNVGIKTDMDLSRISVKMINDYLKYLSAIEFRIIGSYGFENAQVTAGGIPFSEVTDNLESKYCTGLYFAGEILDIDGKCGGYNLQWAWTSGYIAGQHAARVLGE